MGNRSAWRKVEGGIARSFGPFELQVYNQAVIDGEKVAPFYVVTDDTGAEFLEEALDENLTLDYMKILALGQVREWLEGMLDELDDFLPEPKEPHDA
jgi:hypothetical protein